MCAGSSTSVRSLIVAVAALRMTDLIPFSIDECDEYISLRPSTWPSVALRTKYGLSFEPIFRSYWPSNGAFDFTEATTAAASSFVGKMPLVGLANRANVVIGQDGKVTALVEGSSAVDPTSAIQQCPLRKKKGTP